MKHSSSQVALQNKRTISCLAALAVASLVALPIRAQTTWSGGASPDLNWSTGGNWSTATAPGAGEAVVFGATGTVGSSSTINNSVDLSFAGTVGSLTYNQVGSGVYHVTEIPAGQTLTVSGAATVGGLNADGSITLTYMTGGGTFAVNGTPFKVGNAGASSTSTLNATLDMSGLSNFVYNASSSTWILAGNGSDARGGGVLNLAGQSNNITVNTISFNTGSGNNSGFHSLLQFGAGTNILNVGTFVVCQTKAQFATVQFLGTAPATAGVRIRGVNGNSDDTSRANITLGDRNNTGGGNTDGEMLLNGHPVDIKADTLLVGQDRTGSGANTHGGIGILQFDKGTIDANTITMAVESSAGTAAAATGTITVGSAGTLIAGTGGISLANKSGGGTSAAGTLNVIGGQVICSNNITRANSAAVGSIAMTNGSVTLTTIGSTIGTGTLPINALSISNSTLNLPSAAAQSIYVTNLNLGGTTNIINIASLPSINTYPTILPIIQSTTVSGTFNLGVGPLPGGYSGFFSNNAGSILLVVTNGPSTIPITWQGYGGGFPNSSWDTTTANWLTSGNTATAYSNLRFVVFNDLASNNAVSINEDVSPLGITVTNAALTYTFTGGNKITGSGTLTKQGTGTLILDNSGANDFTGGVVLGGGTLQVGNNDGGGNLPNTGVIQNNGTLVFARTDTVGVSNNISGAGSLKQLGGGTLRLGGANSFTGSVWVTNNSTLQLGSSATLPTGTITTVANGSTLDLNGFSGGGSVVTKGVGSGNGAVNNAGGAISGFLGLTNLTITGDITLGTTGNRWDLRSTGGTTGTNLAVFSTGGQPYNLTKVGTGGTGTVPGFLGFVSVAVDTNLADINVQQGTFEVEGNTTSLGNPTNKLTIESGAAFMTYSATNQFNKVIVLKDGGTIQNGNGNNTIIGPLTLTNVNSSANCIFNIGGTSLTLSNVITGDGTLYKTTGTNILNINGNSPNFAGGIYLGAGTIVLNGTLNNALGVTENLGKFAVNGHLLGAGVTVGFASSLTGSGLIDGAVTVNGFVSPGDSNAVATLTMGSLTFQGNAWFDLNLKNGVGGGTNDLIVVNGDLTMNGGNLYINPLTILQTGVSYRLFNYTGNLNWNADPNIPSVNGYTFTLDHSTSGQVNLVASGGPAVWNGGSSTGSTWTDAANWGGTAITVGGALNFGGTTRVNNTNDFADGTSFGDMTFIPGAGSFVLNGGAVALAGDIVNFSTNTETINLGLSYGNNRIIDGDSGRLVINNGLTNTANLTTVTLNGTGTLVDIVGADAAAKTNSVVLSSSNANWTLIDNSGSTPISAPWAFLINSGTFNFGTATSAPNFTNTTVNGAPQDNTLGNIAGATATLNLSNGTFTTTARFNTAAALNCTSIVNQVGGVWNLGTQFQGANGGSAGEMSILNLSGGTLNIGTAANPSSQLYLASRGNGILNLSGSATVNCGTLDLARNAAGNSIACTGVVNLNGGTLAVTRVGTATANAQTGVSFNPSATFNFNGGVLKARGSSSTFFQGSTAAPVIPISAIVKAGGAIVDSDTNSITFLEPLTHDSTLGVTPDGGLLKKGSGTLTLGTVNTYTGPTIVTNGTLAINGSVATAVTVSSNATLAGTGTVSNNVTINNYGSLSPGGANTIGQLMVIGDVTLAANSTNVMDLNKGTATNDLLLATGPAATTITYGGTLVLTNISGSLASTDTFKLFNATNYAGTFSAVLPAVPAPGLGWNTNTLATDGTLRLVATVNLTPTNVTAVVSGNQLTLSWPSDHTGWHLQAQTNSLSAGLGTNWVTIPNTDQSNQYTTTIDPTQGTVFYRMVYP